MHFANILVAAAVVSANSGPPRTQQIVGPNLLESCKCGPVIDMIAKCQQETTQKGTKSCVCAPASQWIPSSSTCRECLLTAKGINLSSPNDFYSNLIQTIVNVYTLCHSNFSPLANGTALCATANNVDACTSISQQSASSDISRAGVYGTATAQCNICSAVLHTNSTPPIITPNLPSNSSLTNSSVVASRPQSSSNNTITTPIPSPSSIKSSSQRLVLLQGLVAVALIAALL